MPVSDIIGTDAASIVTGEEMTDDNDRVIVTNYVGPDPDLLKWLFGWYSHGNLALGIVIAIFWWHVDADYSYTSIYELMFRAAALNFMIFYTPSSLIKLYIDIFGRVSPPLMPFYPFHRMQPVKESENYLQPTITQRYSRGPHPFWATS